MPSVRNPLDSMVLSPHTVKPNEASLVGIEKEFSDYRSVLPSVCSCEYHGRDARHLSGWFARCIKDKFCQLRRVI
jgi:hypothetical protein